MFDEISFSTDSFSTDSWFFGDIVATPAPSPSIGGGDPGVRFAPRWLDLPMPEGENALDQDDDEVVTILACVLPLLYH